MFLRFVLLTVDSAVSLVSSCSANAAKLDLVFSANDDFNNRVRIDYVCSSLFTQAHPLQCSAFHIMLYSKRVCRQ